MVPEAGLFWFIATFTSVNDSWVEVRKAPPAWMVEPAAPVVVVASGVEVVSSVSNHTDSSHTHSLSA